LGQINQLGRDRGKYYCGVVFVSRFICSALADPISHRLVPGQRFLPNRVRRNFQILSSLLRSVLGSHQPEAALLGLSDLLRDFRNKLDTFMDMAIKSKSLDVGERMHTYLFLLFTNYCFLMVALLLSLSSIHKLLFFNGCSIIISFFYSQTIV
jgi:hypothetical protein